MEGNTEYAEKKISDFKLRVPAFLAEVAEVSRKHGLKLEALYDGMTVTPIEHIKLPIHRRYLLHLTPETGWDDKSQSYEEYTV